MATLTSFFSSGSSGGSGTRSACILTSFGTGAYEVFYTDGTFTVPSGVTDIRVKVYGSGGAAGGAFGGAGGGYAMGCIGSLSGGDTFAVVIGQGGSVQWCVPDTFCCAGTNGVCTCIIVDPTSSCFGGGCLCASGGTNGSLFPELRGYQICCMICHSHYCKCNVSHGTGGVGGGTCAAVTNTGGISRCMVNNCATSTSLLCCSICLVQIQAAAGGGGSAATQCGNGYAGFCYCRLWCCQRTKWVMGAIGAAGALGTHKFVHRCDTGHCTQQSVECSSCPHCIENGFGVQPTNQVLVRQHNTSSNNGYSNCVTPVCDKFIGERFHVDYNAVKQGVSPDNPDQPVPGEHLTGAGGLSIASPCYMVNYDVLGGTFNDQNNCCCARTSTPMMQKRELHVFAKAGDGEPGGGGGSLFIGDKLQMLDSCNCCCCRQEYCLNYHLEGGNGGFAAGGGNVFYGGYLDCCTSCNTRMCTSGMIRPGRGGLGGGGSGGFHALPREWCNGRVRNWNLLANGGNGVVVVEY